MDALSVRNDLPGFALSILPIILAIFGVVLVFLWKERLAAFVERGWGARAFWIAIVLSTALLALFFAGLQPHVIPWGGMDRYFVRAMNIVSTGVFGYGTTPTAIFPPGYSFLFLPLLFVLGETRWVFFLTNIVLLILFAVIIRRILVHIGVSERTANLLTLVISFYPNRLLSVVLPFSDVPFALIYGIAFSLLIVRFLRPPGLASAIAIGAIGGIATLVRSNGLVAFLPLLVGIVASAQRQSLMPLRHGFAALAVFLLLLAPWMVRNYTLFGRFVPVSANAGINIAIGNNPSGPDTHNSYIDSVWSESGSWKKVGGEGWNEAQRDSFFAALGVSYIKDHPVDFAVRAVKKLARTFGADNYTFGQLTTYTNATTVVFSATRDSGLPSWFISTSAALVGTGLTLLLLLNSTLYYLLIFFSVYVFFRKGRMPPALRWVLFLLAGGIAAMVIATFGLSRYKEPLEIVSMLFCLTEFLLWDKKHSAAGVAGVPIRS
ncbi:MAG: hypothetical protein WB699_09325 [Bacteroidota bacterium]